MNTTESSRSNVAWWSIVLQFFNSVGRVLLETAQATGNGLTHAIRHITVETAPLWLLWTGFLLGASGQFMDDVNRAISLGAGYALMGVATVWLLVRGRLLTLEDEEKRGVSDPE